MMQSVWAGLALLAMLAACQPTADISAPEKADLSKGVIRNKAAAPKGKAGECWATDTTPAVIETVSEQVEATPAKTDANGKVVTPATYATETHQRILRDRQAIHFRTPCPSEMTADFIASVQRALKARGFYLNRVTGDMDRATRDAIRRFQEPLGLNSSILSLAGAKTLGLVRTELDEL